MSSERYCHSYLSHCFFFLFIFILATTGAYSQSTALQFVSVTPCRIADTRNPPGQFGGPTMDGNTERDFPIPLSACSIPPAALAYSLNVTVVPAGSLNYLTIWPTGEPQPVVSTLNSYDGRTKANAAIVPAGTNASVSVYVTDKTDVILDIDGYFVPASTSTLAFFPLTPCRVADTRGSNGPLGGPTMQANQIRDFPVLASTCNVPTTAEGYSLNMTAVPKHTLGYLTLWPTGETQPYVSTLNAPTGTVVANAAIVPAGTSGAVSVYVTDETDVIIDIDGYFATATPGQGGLSLFSLVPCRVVDTRPPHGSGLLYEVLPVNVLGSTCSVPAAQAYVFNATVVPNNGPMGYLSLWPDAEGQPVVSTLNAYDGAVTSNMAIVPTLNGDVDAYAFNPAWLIMDISSYFAPIQALSITTTSLPAATLNYNYSATLIATGGVQPYSWRIPQGLPSGLSLDPNSGVISGMPMTAPGPYSFSAQVSDSETPPVTVIANLTLMVNANLVPLAITTTTLPNGTQNSPYNAALTATGGVTPYTWSVVSGNLPSGLTLNSSTGVISGAPSGGGTTNFTVQVTDAQSNIAIQSLNVTITPAVPLSISTTSLPNGTAGQSYSAPITAIGGVYPYTWSVTAGRIPDGLTLNSNTGVLSGTPQNVGQSSFTVQVVDSETPQVTATQTLSLTINTPGGNGNPGLLNGNYAFYMNGFNSSGPWTLAGSFIADGQGNITSGLLDGNSVFGSPYTVSISGTYVISAANLNTMTIQGSGWGPMTLAFDLDAAGDSGRMIEYDDTTGQGSRGAGRFKQATPSAFSLNALNGSWVFGMSGADLHHGNQVNRFVNVGQFTLRSGVMSNGTCDQNDGGTYQTCTYTGTVSAVDPQTGRATVSGTSNNGSFQLAVYVVSSSEMMMAQADANAVEAGQLSEQTGPFNTGSMSGNDVLIFQAINGGTGEDQSGAGIINCDGHGNFSIATMDENLAGTITQDPPQQGTYTVQSNGAITLECQQGGCPIGYLISANQGVFVGQGSSTVFGQFVPQTGGPFSNASISGSYAAGSLAPLDYTNGQNELDVASADGNGTMNVNTDSSGSGGLDQSFGTIVSYSISSNGRGTAAAQGDQSPAVVYTISPAEFIVLFPKTDARISIFGH